MEGQRVSKKPARSAYVDVFGGPPRFAAAPFPSRLDDYAEIFGGSGTSCSIPFLDLPPATYGLDGDTAGVSDGPGCDYSEVFGDLDLREFAVPYEDLFSSSRGVKVGSTNGRFPSAINRDLEDPTFNGQPIKESEFPMEDVNEFHVNCIEDDRDCFPLNYDLSNHNSGKCNLSSNVKNNESKDGAARGKAHKPDPPRSILECTTYLQMQKPGAPINKVNNVDLHTSGNEAMSDIKECSSLCPASELNHVNLDLHSHPSSSNSVASDDVTSSNAMYVSVVDINLRTQPLQVPPPTRPPPKACNKPNHPFLKIEPNVEISIEGQPSSRRNEYPECYGFISKSHAPQVVMRDGPSLDVDIDASSAAAAIKKAMELAESRLKSAKELMERKRVNIHNRKKSHHETKSEQKIAQYSFLDNNSVITTQKNLTKEEEKINDIPSEKGNITNVFKENLDLGETTRDVIMSKHSQEMRKENSLALEKKCMEQKMDQEQSRVANKEQSVIVEHVHGQEAIRKMMKGTTSINNDGRYDNKEVTLPSEFKSNNNLTVDKERIDGPKIATDVKEDYDSCKGEPIGDLDNVVLMDPQLQEDFDILQDTRISCSEENKKLEEVRGENLSMPFSVEKRSVAIRNEENLEKLDIREFEVSKDAKYNYEFEDNLHDSESVQVILSDTLELETAKVTSDSGKVEKEFTADDSNSEQCNDGTFLDASMIGAVPHDKEMRMAFVSGMFDVEKELDALCESGDSINTSREEQVEGGHSNNLVQMDRNTMKTLKEAREEPYSKKESSMSEKYDSGVVVDQGTDEIGDNSMIQNATGVISYEPENAKLDGASSQDGNEFKSNEPPAEDQKCNGTPEAVLKSRLLEKSEMQTTQQGGKKVKENEKIGEIHANPDVSEEQVGGGHSNNLVQMDEDTVETLKEDREQPYLKKESSISWKYESGLVVDHDTDKIGENPMKRKGTVVMEFEEPENAKADGPYSEDCNAFKANELPGEDQKCDEMPEAVQNRCLLEKLEEQTMQQGEKEVREDEKFGEVHANPDVSDNIDIVNRDSDASCCLLFKDSDAQSENGNGISELQSAQGAADIYTVGSSKITSNFKKTEDKESETMEKERKPSGIWTRKLEEEEREREKEREKDRTAVERAIHEVHERTHAKARERAERIAVERVTYEARQRALKEAHEKVDKASVLAAEKSVAEQVLKEARLKAERSAVERAIAEARERAAERALAEKAAGNGRERKERSNGFYRDKMSKENGTEEHSKPWNKDGSTGAQFHSADSSSNSKGYSFVDSQKAGEDESTLRCKARLERHQRTAERVAKALAEKNLRDVLAQREQTERNRLAEYLDPDIKRWSNGKEGNLRALLSTLQYILGPESGWQPISLTDVIAATAVKKAYRKATLYVHPDKLQQRGASIRQKYICEKVFDLLKEAWNKFNSEER